MTSNSPVKSSSTVPPSTGPLNSFISIIISRNCPWIIKMFLYVCYTELWSTLNVPLPSVLTGSLSEFWVS